MDQRDLRRSKKQRKVRDDRIAAEAWNSGGRADARSRGISSSAAAATGGRVPDSSSDSSQFTKSRATYSQKTGKAGGGTAHIFSSATASQSYALNSTGQQQKQPQQATLQNLRQQGQEQKDKMKKQQLQQEGRQQRGAPFPSRQNFTSQSLRGKDRGYAAPQQQETEKQQQQQQTEKEEKKGRLQRVQQEDRQQQLRKQRQPVEEREQQQQRQVQAQKPRQQQQQQHRTEKNGQQPGEPEQQARLTRDQKQERGDSAGREGEVCDSREKKVQIPRLTLPLVADLVAAAAEGGGRRGSHGGDGGVSGGFDGGDGDGAKAAKTSKHFLKYTQGSVSSFSSASTNEERSEGICSGEREGGGSKSENSSSRKKKKRKKNESDVFEETGGGNSSDADSSSKGRKKRETARPEAASSSSRDGESKSSRTKTLEGSSKRDGAEGNRRVGLSEVFALDARGKGIEEVEDLSTCKQLRRVDLSENLLKNLLFLQFNLELRWLRAARNAIGSGEKLRAALRNHQNLVVLDLAENQIQRLEDFSALTNLKTLVLSHNRIQRVPFSDFALPNLECLILSHNQIEAVEKPSRPLPRLKKLSLSSNRLKSFPFCSLFPELKELRLHGNVLLNVGTGVICMPSLNILDLSKNQIHRIEGVQALAGHLKLTQLNLLGNPLLAAASPEEDQQQQQILQQQLLSKLPALKIYNTRLLVPRPTHQRKQRWKQQRLLQQQQRQEQQ